MDYAISTGLLAVFLFGTVAINDRFSFSVRLYRKIPNRLYFLTILVLAFLPCALVMIVTALGAPLTYRAAYYTASAGAGFLAGMCVGEKTKK
jgi:hypothetical protein